MEKNKKEKMVLKGHPWYFGVYANMAMHNIFLIMHDIGLKARLGDNTDSTKAKEDVSFRKRKEGTKNEFEYAPPPCLAILNEAGNPVAKDRVIQLLHEHFPFLQALGKTIQAGNTEPSRYYVVFEHLLTAMEDIRNFYTHAYHQPVAIDSCIWDWMHYIYTDALAKAKDRFGWDEKQLLHLRHYDGTEKVNGKKQLKKNKKFGYPLTGDDGKYTEQGLAFFICQFLAKEYSYQFLKKLPGFEDIYSPEVYSIYRCLMPRHKLKSDNMQMAVLLDMLNELERCPRPLYDTLNNEDKDKFLTRESDNPDEAPDSLLLRKENRFRYFALRYIEYMQLFSELRFQVDLGKYVFESYPDAQNAEDLRSWEKNLHVFARLCDLEEQLPEALVAVRREDPENISSHTPVPYLVTTNPHYHFDGNNIALACPGKWNKIEFRKRKSHDKQRQIDVPINQEPDFMLCTHELPGLLFYDFLAKTFRAPASAETVVLNYRINVQRFAADLKAGTLQPVASDAITNQYQKNAVTQADISKNKFKDKFKERKSALASLLQPYGLEPHTIPEKLCHYLMGVSNTDPQNQADTMLKDLLKDTNDRLHAVEKAREAQQREKEEKKTDKLNKKLNRIEHLKVGDRATFLAQDMMYFQPHKTPADGPSPEKFRWLQAAMALYGEYKNELGRIFVECKLTHSSIPHPFLAAINIDKCAYSIHFYEAYLKERKKYLERCISENAADKSYSQGLSFLKPAKTYDANQVKVLCDAISQKVTNLPRGLFKDATIQLINNYGTNEWKEIVNQSKKEPNTVYLLHRYYEMIGDGSQPFYSYKRNYRTVDELLDEKYLHRAKNDTSPIEKKYYSSEELTQIAHRLLQEEKDKTAMARKDDSRFYKALADNVIEHEKQIRYYSACDQVQFIMAKQLMAATAMDDSLKATLQASHLKDIAPDSEKGILNQSFDYKLSLHDKTVTALLKLKDYGKIRKFLKDNRLKELFGYLDENSIDVDTLRTALDLYERKRVELFSAVYDFEILCGKNEQIKQRIDQLLVDPGYAKHTHIMDKYQEIYGLTQEIKDVLTIIRNAFSHNQFPDHAKVVKLLTVEDIMVDDLYNFATKTYTDITQKMK